MPVYEVITRLVKDTKGKHPVLNFTGSPAPTITTNSYHYQVHYMMTDAPPPQEAPEGGKPPYRVPSMREIAALPWNGFNAISTFSGCGGSSLGYKMAGFRVLWANEFIPEAQDTYRANHPDTILDTRDIRAVQPDEVLDAIGLRAGELDLLDGSPPCASFSTSGAREAGWDKVKKYSSTKQRVDDLFFEYTRLIEGIQPKVFVAENVAGLVKGKAKGYFKLILQAMRECGYTVSAKLLDAQWLGVPQLRARLIFVGVRNDLVARYGVQPAHPHPLPYRYTVRDAIPWVTEKRRENSGLYYVEPDSDISRYPIGKEWDEVGVGGHSKRLHNFYRAGLDKPSNAIVAAVGLRGMATVTHPTEKRRFSIAELRRICAFPDDFMLTGTYAQQWERLGRAVPPVMMYHIANTVRDEIQCKMKEH